MNIDDGLAWAEFSTQIFSIGLPGASRDGTPETMGFKAFNLARMAKLGLPVPAGFVLGTAWCAHFARQRSATLETLRPILDANIHALEMSCGLQFGAERKPLLVSIRSGAPISMPGMMDTVLNVGLTENTLHGFLRATGNPRLVWDSYRRLIQQFAEIVHGADPQPFRAELDSALERARVTRPQDLDFRSLAELARASLALFERLVGSPFPQDPFDQLERAVSAVFQSWMSPRAVEYRRMHAIADDLGTAVTVQRMVFGNAGGTSGSGVGFTRDPSSGDNALYLDFRFNSQGEDVVSGRHSANDAQRLAAVLPGAYRQLSTLAGTLESEFRDAQEFEFTVQDGMLWMLQTRAAKRTPWAALRIAVEQVDTGLLTPAEALSRLGDVDLDRVQRHHVEADGNAQEIALAIPASIGVATGCIALDAETVRRNQASGKPSILVREDTSTSDLTAMAAAAGVLTRHGGRTAHAAVVARQLGKPCLVGCATLSIDLAARLLRFGDHALREGQILSLDCDGGRVFAGEIGVRTERPEEWLRKIASWRTTAATSRQRQPD